MVATGFITVFFFFPSSFCFLSTYYGQGRSEALAMQRARKMDVVPGLLVPTGWWRFRQANRRDHRAWEHVRGCSRGRTLWGTWRAPDQVPAHTEVRGVTDGWGGAGLRTGKRGDVTARGRATARTRPQGEGAPDRPTLLPCTRVNTDKKRAPVFFLANHWYVSTPLFILNFPIHYPPS